MSRKSITRKSQQILSAVCEPLEARQLLSTWTVTNSSNSGAGSLRTAILNSNGATGSQLIVFNIPKTDSSFNNVVFTLKPTTALPTISNAVTIDGTSQQSFSGDTNNGHPVVFLDGSNIGNNNGLVVGTSNVGISYLGITNFHTSSFSVQGGIVLSGSSAHNITVQNCMIGIGAAGTSAQGNTVGVFIGEGANLDVVTGCTISGNGAYGVEILGGSNNDIDNNNIGSNLALSAAVANGVGVQISSTPADGVCTGNEISGGEVSGNTGDGIVLTGTNTSGTHVYGVNIGVDKAFIGYFAIPNGGDGIHLSGSAHDNQIGSNSTGTSNLIAGNTGNGVEIDSASNNNIQGNDIGEAFNFQQHLLGNGGSGVYIHGSSSSNNIGSAISGLSNTISGNSVDGIDVNGTTLGNLIYGNLIGLDTGGATAVPNGAYGVLLENGASSQFVGNGTASGSGNYISGNTAAGVSFSGSSTSLNHIELNTIGLNTSGAKLANGGEGIIDFGSNNTIFHNVISGNTTSGISIPGSGNVVTGNLIGTSTNGASSIANGSVGIYVNGSGNTIGGTTTASRNVISGEGTQFGIQIDQSSAVSNTVEGNYIGVDSTGANSLANSAGVKISGGANQNTIGPSNVISGNSGDGVDLTGANTASNTVSGNDIGLNAAGNAALANGTGVVMEVGAGSNTIGGTTVANRNVISGNTGPGVFVDGTTQNSTGNIIEGNYIGTDSTGSSAIANAGGVLIQSASASLIGGTTAGAGNLIADNTVFGVEIAQAGATSNIVAGNTITFSPIDVIIEVGANQNTIGGTTTAARNVISGSSTTCVQITDYQTSNNVVEGNYIGTDSTGNAAGTDPHDGIQLLGASTSNTIANNLISGIDEKAVRVESSSNFVQGNLIGLNAAGTAALTNGNGIYLGAAATSNTIGGTTASTRNIISGSGGDGIVVSGSLNTGNLIEGNYIGTNAAGTSPVPNGGDGIDIIGAAGTTIGGLSAGAGNVISGNTLSGIAIFNSTATSNIIRGNFIGTAADGTSALGNGASGIKIQQSANGNTVGGLISGGNKIFFNTDAGIAIIGASSTGNAIHGNSISSNTGLGIDLNDDGVTANDSDDSDTGPNNLQNYPTIVSVYSSIAQSKIETAIHSAPSTMYTFEYFWSTTADPSGYGEAQHYIGNISRMTDATGSLDFAVVAPSIPAGAFLTATATAPNGDTSEFSAAAAIVTVTPPVITGFTLAATASPQELDVQLSGDVDPQSIVPADLILQDQSAQVIPTSAIAVSFNSITDVATFTFPGEPGGVLPSASYSASIHANTVYDHALDPNASAGNYNFIWVNGTSAADTITVTKATSSLVNVTIMNSSSQTFAATLGTLNMIALAGGAGDDVVTVDLTNGSPIPSGGISFDGQAGTDSIGVVGTDGSENISFNNTGFSILSSGNAKVSQTNTEGYTFDGKKGNDQVQIVSGPTVTFVNPQVLSLLDMLPHTSAACAVGGHAPIEVSVFIDDDPSSCKLDLYDNDMLLPYSGTSPLAAVQTLISQARAGGTWNGAGITSTSAKNRASHNTTLGVMESSDYKTIYGSNATFDNFGLTSPVVLVKYTYYGDSNFNGQVDGSDYAKIDTNYGSQSFGHNIGGWFNGDFDGNGKIDGTDYALIDAAFASQGQPINPPAVIPIRKGVSGAGNAIFN